MLHKWLVDYLTACGSLKRTPGISQIIVFQIQVKEMLSVALGNEPETEPGSVTCTGGQAETSPHAAVF